MANSVDQKQPIDLLSHPSSTRPTRIQFDRTSPNRSPRIHFVESKCYRLKCGSLRTFGGEAYSITDRGKLDHLSMHYRDPSIYGQKYQNSSSRDSNSSIHNKSSSIIDIFQPGSSATPLTAESFGPCLRGEESLENWRSGQGSLSLSNLPSQQASTGDVPPHSSKFNTRNDEFRENLWKDRYRRHFFLEHDLNSSIYRRNGSQPRENEETRAVSLRGRELTNDGISTVLNQGWSEYSGMRRAQSAADIRPSKASTPYCGVDSISTLWNSKPETVEKRLQVIEPYIHETSPSIKHRDGQGVAAALNYSKNFTMEQLSPVQRLQFDGIENVQKGRRFDSFERRTMFSSRFAAGIRPEAQKIADSHRGDGIKSLMTSSNLEALPPPIRRKLSPSGRRIANMSRGGAAKACLNPPNVKRLPMRAMRK